MLGELNWRLIGQLLLIAAIIIAILVIGMPRCVRLLSGPPPDYVIYGGERTFKSVDELMEFKEELTELLGDEYRQWEIRRLDYPARYRFEFTLPGDVKSPWGKKIDEIREEPESES